MEQFLHPQQRTTTCAIAAIRTVLHRQFGVQIAEAALVAMATRPDMPVVKHGSSTTEMRRAVRGASQAYNAGAPWTLRVRQHGTFRMLQWLLKHGRWPIVQVFVEEVSAHHAVVVTAITPTKVQYYDPDQPGRKLRWMSRKRFTEWWTCPIYGNTWFAAINGGVLKE